MILHSFPIILLISLSFVFVMNKKGVHKTDWAPIQSSYHFNCANNKIDAIQIREILSTAWLKFNTWYSLSDFASNVWFPFCVVVFAKSISALNSVLLMIDECIVVIASSCLQSTSFINRSSSILMIIALFFYRWHFSVLEFFCDSMN